MKLTYMWTDSSTCVFLYAQLKYKNAYSYTYITKCSTSYSQNSLLKDYPYIKIGSYTG